MKPIKFYDVFVPGGIPTITYNPRKNHKLEQSVLDAKQNICKLLIVSGQTKSGKTVLVEKVFPRDDSIWVDGGAISTEDSFWEVISNEIDIPTETTTHDLTNSSIDTEVGLNGQLNFAIMKATPSGKVTSSMTDQTGNVYRRSATHKTIVLKYLSDNKIPLILDDFHYINRDVQTKIIRALKSPIMHGLPVIFIAIPNRKFDVVKVEREMTGRIEVFDIPVWSESELMQIADSGFRALNISLPKTIQLALAKEALGSPHLMQEFCKEICKDQRIESNAKHRIDISDSINLDPLFESIAKNSGHSLFQKLARGPRQRSDRIQRKLKNGKTTDIYGVVMEALLKMKPGMESVNYDVFRGYMRETIEDELPQMHEVSRVLEKISEISYNQGASTPVIDWDKDEDVLTITDPFFAFYLRWIK